MRRYISCNDCGHEEIVSERLFACPNCESENVSRCVVVECCGEDLFCPGFTNTCPHCGADYNWGGQHLAPRSCWGAETGETVEEILAIDDCSAEEIGRAHV